MVKTTIAAAAVLCCTATIAMASGNTVFTGSGLDGCSTYDEWKAEQVESTSSSASGVAASFDAGGYTTGVSATYIALEARFRTWLASAGRALRSDAVKGLMVIFR